jgi:hypothetical protein
MSAGAGEGGRRVVEWASKGDGEGLNGYRRGLKLNLTYLTLQKKGFRLDWFSDGLKRVVIVCDSHVERAP